MATIIDGKDHILGRLSSVVAEKIMDGEEVVVLNARDIIVTGEKYRTFADYKNIDDLGKIRKGPYPPRRADLLMKRTVRGMIPFKKPKGREAYKRLKVYVGVPKEFEGVRPERIEDAMSLNTSRYTTLGEVAKFLGSNVR
ncbi:MAG: large subunit ribosomal protein [Candidatus Methanomethylophilaceae archaeon]|jgi:large subunit ribosomal protein L13|nr:large subunit ribosomal protein [Candidatus Methanomethylophilaceae archaeon]MDI3541569.1 large subunit ribosomal protein [Candidatus Methanomethylophilaceae archaeon]